jgi:hypothetical protein
MTRPTFPESSAGRLGKVADVDRSPLDDRSVRDQVESERIQLTQPPDRGSKPSVPRDQPRLVALDEQNRGVVGIAEAGRRLCDGGQHRPEVAERAGTRHPGASDRAWASIIERWRRA